MIHVKICGLTRKQDVEYALECGADSLGFVFEPTSPRCVLKNGINVKSLVSDVPEGKHVVAVFGSLPTQAIALPDRFDSIQYIEGNSSIFSKPYRIIRTIRLAEDSTPSYNFPNADAILIDAYHEKHLGGTGVTTDWESARMIRQNTELPVFLAGGLTPGNVRMAIEKVEPYGVDVSSGVEDKPGIKDPVKLKLFIFEAKKAL